MQQEDYTVQIEAFQGPLDLLLFLIKRAEVDITDIPIAKVTLQYLDFLKGLKRIDVELAGEFLVMAATLMEVKSRMLMPPEPRPEGEEGAAEGDADAGGLDASDPRYELVKQLLAYKKFRDAAADLDERRHEWALRFPSARIAQSVTKIESEGGEDASDEPVETDLEDIGVWDLFEVFQRIIDAVDFGRMDDHQVEYDDTPIRIHQEDLLSQIETAPDRRLSLRTAMKSRSRSEMIGLFLATLELARENRVTIEQDRPADDILLVWRAAEDVDIEGGTRADAVVESAPVDEADAAAK